MGRSIIGSAYQRLVISDTPYIYYRLGDSVGSSTAVDYSGNGFNGTVGSGVTFGQTGLINPESNTSAYFDASTGSYINTEKTTNFLTSLTLEAIIKLDATQPQAAPQIISKNQFYASSASSFSCALRYLTSSGQLQFTCSNGVGFDDDLLLSYAISTGASHIVQAVYRDHGQCELWIDKTMVASSTIGFKMGSTTKKWAIGSAPEEYGGGINQHRLKGFIDEPAIYGYALSSAQLQAHATAAGF